MMSDNPVQVIVAAFNSLDSTVAPEHSFNPFSS
jgi:hypothetical protein